ncbi:beta-propeller fold lactonase family protein [Novosphingobium flavum]|uniref:Beta-propeller fold lactonase family protein n=1 Tax=Novosphingobium flavum TaxID=1778672 RepID=A0A7X1FSB2_9SPHN|nr:beta-propeller fold lactonase family protein [Novosphingobium flavum]MBC2666078.1 beta-propeller fold lactonase family protein [Novosphingobium flavum]
MSAPVAKPARPISAYVAVGATITNYVIDPATGTLTQRGSIVLPARLQYAWPHPSLPILYAACADRAPAEGTHPFQLCALWRDEEGNLAQLGESAPLAARPIHNCTDVDGGYALTAYGDAPGLTVHKLNADGTIGAEVPRDEGFEFGNKPHQIRVTPHNQRAILVSRGNKGFGGPKYIEGGFRMVAFRDGAVRNEETVIPPVDKAPRGFNPRNVDFHPTEPIVYAVMEPQNELWSFRMDGSVIAPDPLSADNILALPEMVHKRQDGGAVEVHPSGRYVYVANRNDGYVDGHAGPSWLNPDPLPVFPGGENNIAVFDLAGPGGRPVLVQHVDTRGLHPRTFAVDPTGRYLVAGNNAPTVMPGGEQVPASLAVFGIGDDGRLTFLYKHDLDVGAEKVWWMGIAG